MHLHPQSSCSGKHSHMELTIHSRAVLCTALALISGSTPHWRDGQHRVGHHTSLGLCVGPALSRPSAPCSVLQAPLPRLPAPSFVASAVSLVQLVPRQRQQHWQGWRRGRDVTRTACRSSDEAHRPCFCKHVLP